MLLLDLYYHLSASFSNRFPVSIHFTDFPTLLAKAASQLNESIKKSTSVTTLKEYSMALEDISGLIATCSNSISSNMDSALEIALVLLRDGPEGWYTFFLLPFSILSRSKI